MLNEKRPSVETKDAAGSAAPAVAADAVAPSARNDSAEIVHLTPRVEWGISLFLSAPESTPYFIVSLNDLIVKYTVFCVCFSAAHVNFIRVMFTLLLSTQFLELGLMHFTIHIYFLFVCVVTKLKLLGERSPQQSYCKIKIKSVQILTKFAVLFTVQTDSVWVVPVTGKNTSFFHYNHKFTILHFSYISRNIHIRSWVCKE